MSQRSAGGRGIDFWRDVEVESIQTSRAISASIERREGTVSENSGEVERHVHKTSTWEYYQTQQFNRDGEDSKSLSNEQEEETSAEEKRPDEFRKRSKRLALLSLLTDIGAVASARVNQTATVRSRSQALQMNGEGEEIADRPPLPVMHPTSGGTFTFADSRAL
eukprot:scaffold1835_cov76-Alexandrium_tamarense.AAC.1